MIATSSDGTAWNKTTLNSAGPFAGDTVGYWMSLAVDNAGQVHAAYRDARFGYYENDGRDKASTLYDQGEVISQEDASGVFNSLTFDQQGNPVMAYWRDRLTQEIVLRYKKGSTWEKKQLRQGETSERISLSTDGKGTFGLAYYHIPKLMLGYMEAKAGLATWTDTQVDTNLTNNGKFSSLVYDSKGNPAISYYQCGGYSGGASTSCDATKDALMFAYRINNVWQTYTVDDGDLNYCGTYSSLAFSPKDEPVIAYQCVGKDKNNEFVEILKVARGYYK
jgi:hypothetical protein